MMTVADLIYGQKPLFKRVHSEDLARERQVDKYLMRLYIKIVEEAKASGENMGEAQRVYMRVS
jgi:type VI protein secretion system component VasK